MKAKKKESKQQWQIDYEQRVKAIQKALQSGHKFYVDTYLGKLEFLTLDETWVHTKDRSWAICSTEIYRWAEEIGITKDCHLKEV